jgi:hypothetical protein
MKATITATGETITGKTLKGIKSKLNGMLKVDGPRGLAGKVNHIQLAEQFYGSRE